MDSPEVERLVEIVANGSAAEADAAWTALAPLGAAVVPSLAAVYARTARWQGRVRLVYHAIRFARESEAAVQLGLAACRDRATLVRHRACGLLAYAQRPETQPALEALRRHPDARTREDAAAALDALRARNHHYFIDRTHSGQITWQVGADGPDAPDHSDSATPASGGGLLQRLRKLFGRSPRALQ